jgi:hypothetical protein
VEKRGPVLLSENKQEKEKEREKTADQWDNTAFGQGFSSLWRE